VIGLAPEYTADIETILGNTRRIALVGAAPKEHRPSHWIMKFLLDRGYDVVPVRPGVKMI
jgi:hypothetical protein